MFVLVTGGAASGKSEYAEELVLRLACGSSGEKSGHAEAPCGSSGGKSGHAEALCGSSGGKNGHAEAVSQTGRVYLATMEPFGSEAEARIMRHRKLREGKGFTTIECPVNIRSCLPVCTGQHVLLEDLPNLAANETFSSHGTGTADLAELILELAHVSASLTCVTGILTADGRAYDESTMRYLRGLSSIEQELAAHADCVVEVVCGVPNVLNSTPMDDKNYIGRDHRMIFITGPMFSGKKKYIKSALNLSDEEFENRAIRNVQELAADNLEELAVRLARKDIVIADEIGCGVVPLDPSERERRERAGRLACMLADRADTVIRVVCGCPQFLKGREKL